MTAKGGTVDWRMLLACLVLAVVLLALREATDTAPLLADRALVDSAPSAYACSGFACRAPVSDPDALMTALRDG